MFALPDHHVVTLRGRDAVAFAQAQFMSDVAALAAGHWHWSGWLTPKGRVVALFALLKNDAETVHLVLQDRDPVEFAAQLRRFVFRSKLEIETGAGLHVGGRFDAHSAAIGALVSPSGGEGIAFDLGGAGGARTLFVGQNEDAGEDAAAVARWAMFDLAHGLPRLPEPQSGQWTPQQLSLERLHAYSVRKGCYPGQEIVARTHFLGQAKRGLALFEYEGPLAAGQQVVDAEHSLGTIASTAGDGTRHLALAVLPLDARTDAASVDGLPLRPIPLLDGLAR
jgi:tRNA-modifying protein YgfZ